MGAVRHRFTVEEYRKMGEAGIFSEDDRVELIDGEVVEMTPIGWRHARCVMLLNRLLNRWVFSVEASGGSAPFVIVQDAITFGPHGEPQPDLALVERPPAGRLPVPAEVLLVMEVADTSLQQDREVKLPLYSRAGIPEAWLVDLNADTIEVYSEPGPAGYYGRVARSGRERRVVSVTLPDLAFYASEALPPEA
jgi:Uma2 family endonuclease